jgi:AcrR family transcriptional regulator
MSSPTNAVKDRILDAAERVFAEHGYEAAAMRQLTQRAKVNLAAVNYHFGGKQALYTAMVSQRLRALNETRLASLERAEQEAGSQPVPVARVIELLVRPVFELSADGTHGGAQIIRILGRSLAEPLPFMDAVLAAEFQPTMARFSQAVRRSMPQLSPEDFLWRLSFVIGAMQHTFTVLHRMSELTSGICRNDDRDGALRRFIEFAVGAFSAPALPADAAVRI